MILVSWPCWDFFVRSISRRKFRLFTSLEWEGDLLYIYLFMYLFIYLFSYSFIYLFICLFIYDFIYLWIPLFINWLLVHLFWRSIVGADLRYVRAGQRKRDIIDQHVRQGACTTGVTTTYGRPQWPPTASVTAPWGEHPPSGKRTRRDATQRNAITLLRDNAQKL